MSGSPRGGRRRIWWLVGGLVVLAVLVFGGVYFVAFSRNSPAELQLDPSPAPPAGPATSAGQASAPLEGRWTVVAAESTAGYRVREQLARLPAPSDAVGRTSAIDGGFTIASEGGQRVARDASFRVDVTQLRSDESRRDNRIRQQGLQSDTFTTATFTSTAPIVIPPPALAGQPARVTVDGDLAIHGVTRRVSLPLDVRLNGPRIEVVGSYTFPFSDFGMEPPSIGGFVTVEPQATLEFRLLFQRA